MKTSDGENVIKKISLPIVAAFSRIFLSEVCYRQCCMPRRRFVEMPAPKPMELPTGVVRTSQFPTQLPAIAAIKPEIKVPPVVVVDEFGSACTRCKATEREGAQTISFDILQYSAVPSSHSSPAGTRVVRFMASALELCTVSTTDIYVIKRLPATR